MQPYLMGLTATPKTKQTNKWEKGNDSNKTYQKKKKLLLITFSKTYSFSSYPLFEIAMVEHVECTRAIQRLNFSYSVSFISVGLGAAQISL